MGDTGYNRLYYILLAQRISCLTTNSKRPNKHFECKIFLYNLLCPNWAFFSNINLSINSIFRADKCRHLSAPPNCDKLVSSNISRSSYRLFTTIMHTSEKTYARSYAGFIISENQLKLNLQFSISQSQFDFAVAYGQWRESQSRF